MLEVRGEIGGGGADIFGQLKGIVVLISEIKKYFI